MGSDIPSPYTDESGGCRDQECSGGTYTPKSSQKRVISRLVYEVESELEELVVELPVF